MTRNSGIRTPKYRRHKRPQSRDQAFVEFDGARHYLGFYNSQGIIGGFRASR